MSALATLMAPEVRYSRFSLNGYMVLTGPNPDNPSLMDAAVLFTTIRLVGYTANEMEARLKILLGQMKPAIDAGCYLGFSRPE